MSDQHVELPQEAARLRKDLSPTRGGQVLAGSHERVAGTSRSVRPAKESDFI